MAIIFQTRFQNSLDTDFPDGAPYFSGNYKRVSGRGIDYGNAFTCSSGVLQRMIAPYLGSNYTTLTTRVQWGLVGNVPDDISGLPNVPGLTILQWGDPISADTSGTALFSSYLTSKEDGAIMLYITKGASFDSGRLNHNSAPGVLTYDGRMHGIQVTFAFSGHTSVTYNVVVNNVSVVSGTFTAGVSYLCSSSVIVSTWAIDCNQRAAITGLSLRASRNPGSWMTSAAEMQVEDTVNIISYPPCNAIPAALDACTPFIPPELPTPDISGIYFIAPSTQTHDRYYNDVEKKIPDPTVKTGGIGS